MKRKILILIISISIISALFICIIFRNKESSSTNIYGQWSRIKDEETEVIYFGKDNHFSYYTTEGNAVGDYDLCEEYKLNKSNNEIKLICDGKLSDLYPTTIQIKEVTSKFVKLQFNDEIKEFNKE